MPPDLHGYMEPIQTINILSKDLLDLFIVDIRAENYFFKRPRPPEPFIDSDGVGAFAPAVRLSREVHVYVWTYACKLGGVGVPVNTQMGYYDAKIRELSRYRLNSHRVHTP